jgi:hypothetical protein
MKHIAIFLIFFGLLGCTPFGGFKPIPMSWTYYLGDGASEAEIRMALLECGSNVPGEFIEFSSPDGKGFLVPQQRLNETIMVEKCMQNEGFAYSGDKDTCKRWKDLPACNPDAVIPKRSIENRINSPYCKIYPKIKICQPDYFPSKAELSKQVNPKPISIAPSIDPATKLQSQGQKDSNTQMNQLLQGAAGRK